MRLTAAEAASPVAEKCRAWAEQRLQQARLRNDQPMPETERAILLAEIRVLKDWLQLLRGPMPNQDVRVDL